MQMSPLERSLLQSRSPWARPRATQDEVIIIDDSESDSEVEVIPLPQQIAPEGGAEQSGAAHSTVFARPPVSDGEEIQQIAQPEVPKESTQSGAGLIQQAATPAEAPSEAPKSEEAPNECESISVQRQKGEDRLRSLVDVDRPAQTSKIESFLSDFSDAHRLI